MTMRDALGMLLMFGWLVMFAMPFGLVFWSMSEGGDHVAAWTGWPNWAATIASVVGGLVVSAAWIVLVWPRLFGMSKRTAAPEFATLETSPAMGAPAAEQFVVTTETESRPVSQDASSRVPQVSTEQIQAVYREAETMSRDGRHVEACRRAIALNGQQLGWITNPQHGCVWGRLEASADAARSIDRRAAGFVYELCVEEAKWAQHFATASGEAMAEQVNISRLQAKSAAC